VDGTDVGELVAMLRWFDNDSELVAASYGDGA